MPRRLRQLPDGSAVGTIGVNDPFDLIRHLARSQSDPRKAVAELVQNALDEQATHVTIERYREGGEALLSILDDGLGVLPDQPRKDALTAIATNIGHSRKRQLSFDERMRQAMLGQYGIGLLGFWAVGHELRISSCVAGSEVWALTLFEDSPRYTVSRMPDVIDRGPTWTEVQVRRLHRAAIAPTVGGRLATYLSVELRGQLVRHGTELRLVDRIARGSADKLVVIKPSHLAGERLPGLEPIRLPDFKYPIELTLHFAGDAGPDAGRVRLACAGAVVLDDLASLPELAHAPWTDERLVGVIDFPHLEVPPGSRRGIVPNAAAAALVDALVAAEPLVAARLEERSRAEAASLSEDLHRQLARLFTRATSFVPHLEWFPVARKSGLVDEAPPGGTAVPPPAPDEAPSPAPEAERPGAQPELFPPGPLHSVAARPAKLELAVGERRELKAVARDEHGRAIEEGVHFEWRASGALSLAASNELAALEGLRASSGETVEVVARQGERERMCVVPVRVLSELHRRADAGIPQPEELNEPLQPWRSRLVDERWQINTGHPDYRAFATEPRPRLRYLAMLLSKEVVSRNFPQPGVGGILEELVGLLAALERSGAWGRARDD
ncbi:MAG: ATP-binding protein [Deltaproteobacteria bacterium]|nr:ATP-binding protein [Deltaproteobacteria bacterium]